MFLTEKRNNTLEKFRNSSSENQNSDDKNSKRNNDDILMREISSSLPKDIIRNDTYLSMDIDAQTHLVRYKIFDF